jgi:hypothetical protein
MSGALAQCHLTFRQGSLHRDLAAFPAFPQVNASLRRQARFEWADFCNYLRISQ